MSKGEETRERILGTAFRLARRDGIQGLSIGVLASELGMSKSGLFAHFGSKEDLEVAVIEEAADRFAHKVVRPAIKAPRGVPRIRELFERWLRWLDEPESEGGCLFVQAAAELDDREGRPRDALVASQAQLMATLEKAVRIAVEVGHFKPNTNPSQLAFELLSITQGYHYFRRLLKQPHAETYARQAFQDLVARASASNL